MNWLAWMPDWITLPLGFCLGAPFEPESNVQLEGFGAIETYWWLLLLAMIAGLIGTYLGAWQDKPWIKAFGYGAAAALIIAFIGFAHAPTFVTVPANDLEPLGWFFDALGSFSFWLALSLPIMFAAIAIKWRWPGEPGKIASSVFSEYLSFLCLCWMFFAFALHNCT